MNPSLRRSAAHVFVESLTSPALADDDRHHLVRVLRLRAGEPVSVADGQGSWRICRFADGGELLPDTEIVTERIAGPPVTIGFALPKGDRPEWIVQKLTEIGVDRIVILDAVRSVTHWEGDRATRHLAKLGRVAREASMQSRRVMLPTIDGPVRPDAFIRDQPAGAVALAEPDGPPPTLSSPSVLIGPEGGWSQAELALTPEHVGLGRGLLRIETAALVAGARLAALRDD